MKNVIKTLEAQIAELQQQFDSMEQRKTALEKERNDIVVEQLRLQGEYRRLMKLMEDFKDEPKEQPA